MSGSKVYANGLVASTFVRDSLLTYQITRDVGERLQRGLEVFQDFGVDYVRRRKISGLVERFALQPEDVEVDLGAFDKILTSDESTSLFVFSSQLSHNLRDQRAVEIYRGADIRPFLRDGRSGTICFIVAP